MVFESVVVDLLNKYLGKYVENLDSSQLKIGIWGGNVVLENLVLKDTALDDLDLPIKVVKGYLGKLTLSIPWKNLYHESTIVVVEELHLLAKPNFGIKYNAEREEKASKEKKQQQIENIEEARRIEEEKKLAKKDKKAEESDSFAEKLATNVIKNLQVTIRNIHIRYEDDVSDPASPFSIGITLEGLSAQTTDKDFVPKVIKESVTIIHKLVCLDHLAIYWNTNEVIKTMNRNEWLDFSKKGIANSNKGIESIDYILKPLMATKKLKINTKPGLDMNIPKVFLSVVLEELNLVLIRSQYHGLIQLLESFERMNRNIPFRKFRPHETLKENTKAWWNYAIQSILVVDVQRRSQMWSWNHIKEYRAMCKKYKDLHKQKLLQKSLSKTSLGYIEQAEKELNVVSITIFRQLAINEVLREKKAKSNKPGFFASLFGSKEEEKKTSSKIGDFMGSDKDKEMQKLYDAIGYSESEVITAFPAEYVANIFCFNLSRISITLREDTSDRAFDVIWFTLDQLNLDLQQRPSAKGLKVQSKIQSMKLHGTKNIHEIPIMIRSITKVSDTKEVPAMVDFVFEMNPLNKEHLDQSVKAVLQPVEFVYDANTINKAIAFFKPPEHVILQDLHEKASSTFEEFKVSSTAGLLYAMEERTILAIDVLVNASYLIIPQKGQMAGCSDMVVIDFGSLHIKSDPFQKRITNVKDIDNIADAQKNAYDRFIIKLTDLQIMLCRDGEDFQEAREDSESKKHILHPIVFEGNIAKALVPNDPRLKQISVEGSLCALELTVSDEKISRMAKLFEELPLPSFGDENAEEDPFATPERLPKAVSFTNLATTVDTGIHSLQIPTPDVVLSDSDETVFHTPPEDSILRMESTDEQEFESGIANQVKLELNFEVRRLGISVALTDKNTRDEKKCVEVQINNISSLVTMRRWDMFVNASIGQFLLTEENWGELDEPLQLLYTPENEKMLEVSYRKCEFDQSLNLGLMYLYSQEAHIRALQFKNEYQSTRQLLNVKAAMLHVTLHQEGLLSVMSLAQQVLEPLSKKDETPTVTLKRGISSMGSRLSLPTQEEVKKPKIRKKDKKTETAICELKEKAGVEETIDLQLTALLDGVNISIKSAKTNLADAFVKGLSAYVKTKEEKTELKAHMRELCIIDNFKETNYPNIISMSADQVFDLEVVIFNEGTAKAKALDINNVDTIIKATFGQMKVVFLNRFIKDILSFVDNFEDAKSALVDAGKAARERAVEAVTEYSSYSSRHQLNVIVRAPTIIIPVNSLSNLILLVDLGELRLFNSFKIQNKEKGPRGAIITDHLSIKLKELQLLKALTKQGSNKILAQRALIDPVSLKLFVVRNLTTANHEIPDIDVQGTLHTINLAISEEDINVALRILNGNLAEGEIVKAKKKPTKEKDGLLDPAIGKDRLASIYEEEEDASVNVYMQTFFKFELEKIILKLYLKPFDMTFEDEFLERSDALLLSEFTIGHFETTGKMYSDASMVVGMHLETLILDDKRPSSEDTLTRMMDCCPELLVEVSEKYAKKVANKRMLELEYSQSADHKRNVNLSVNNLLTILNMEFLMVLIRTLLATIPNDESSEDKVSESLGSPTHSITSSDGETEASMADLDTTLTHTHDTPTETRVQLNVNNPQIVFLADAKDIKTNALFLTTEVNLQYLEINGIQKIMGTIVDTAIFSTAFKKQHRTDTSQVLSLDTVNLHSSAPIGGKQHLHISATEVRLSIAPKTIRTLSACVNQTTFEDVEDVKKLEKAMLKLWEFHDVSNKKLWYLQTPPANVLSAGSFVLARTEDGNYQNGFLSKQDTHFLVFFYPEGSISHCVSDVTSVVIDVAPAELDCTIGENVVALHSPEDGFRTGRIMEVWKGTSEYGSETEVGQEVFSDEEWEPTEKTEGTFNKYLVKFYHDNSEKYFMREEMRLVTRPLKGKIPGLGACVYARYKDGFYYRGFIEKVLDFKIRIDLEEIDNEVEHDKDDNSAVILNITPREGQVKKLFKVVAQKSEASKGYHPGKVIAVQGNPGYRSYTIKFEDGTTNQVPITKLLLMPKAPYDVLPELGTYVYSRVARDSPLYEKGIVADKDKERIYVKHLNGRKLAHDRKMISFVIRNIVPLQSSIRVGQDVIGQIDSDDQKMYKGTVKDIVKTAKGVKNLVVFTDGSSKKLTPGRLRILSTFGCNLDDEIGDSQGVVGRREQLIFEVEGVSVSFQMYLGGLLTPVLRFDLQFHAEVMDWSKKLNAYATMSLGATYYNETVAEWEPLVEPIVENNREKRWQLSLTYVTEDGNISDSSGKSDEVALLQKPMTSLLVQSNDNLEVTITKSSLELLQNISKIFGEAVESSDIVQKIVDEMDPFIVYNMIGKAVTISTNEAIQSKEGTHENIVIEKFRSIPLKYAEKDNKQPYQSGKRKMNDPIINVQVEGFKVVKSIVIKQQRTIIYDLVSDKMLQRGSGVYSIVVEIKARDGQRDVFLRSPLQLKNHFPMPIDLSYLNKDEEQVKLSTVEAGCTYSVPLLPAYHSPLNLKPAGFSYKESNSVLDWRQFNDGISHLITSAPPEEDMEPFIIKTFAVLEEYTSVHGMLGSVPRYLIHCYPPVTLHNYLPYPLKYCAKGMNTMETLDGGASWPLYSVIVEERPVLDLEITEYLGSRWCGSIAISGVKEDQNTRISTFYLVSQDTGKQMDFGIYSVQEGTLNVTFFAPYWLLNKTGKTLIYQAIGSDHTYEHSLDSNDALMFQIKAKKKKARLAVKGCSWSGEFPLDTIGSGGSLKSEGIRGRVFEIGVSISVSYFGLTKIVTFTPLRNLTNHTKEVITMAESDSETAEWHFVKPGESVPYWATCLPPKNLFININGIDSAKFNPETGKTLLLKFRNEIGGVCVNYQEKDASSLLSFSPYFDGAAPARIENLCKKISMISYKQVGYTKGHILTYGQSVLYTWDDPTCPHELLCAIIECSESQKKIKLDANDFGRMKTNDNNAIYWVSFLDGLQRVLLFTDDFKTAYCASEEQTLRPTQEINVNLEGFGLSLVEPDKRMEIGYLGIRKSKVVWEQYKKRWKTMPGRLCDALEEGYDKYTNRKTSAKEKILDMEVDFEKMFITKPERIKIRRTFHSGLEFQYKISPNRMQIRAAISSLQFDSHVPGSTFLTVIHEVEPPKSVVKDNALKPFFELSLTTNVGDKNIVSEISYFKVLIQEMDISLDYGFLVALLEFFNNDNVRGTQKQRYDFDMSVVKQKLEDSPEFQAAKQDTRYVFDYFHLSPLKIHLSFSMTGGHSDEKNNKDGASSGVAGNVLGLLMQSVGVAFTEVQDAEFKLACFEIESLLMSKSQLLDHFMKHYQNQAIKQLYVLVLGLDVLGNPYGLITGVGTGAKNFFYEPYQGLIQGPEEFAEGLAYGVKSLVGGTVGGVSGAVSKITGTVGKGLAALTMDDEFQQKRRQQMSQRPTNLGQGLVRGGKGLVKGIVSGVTGVVVKPYEGAKSEGAGGFFKGIGKGLIGVVARPAGGVVDMASNTFEGLKSTTVGVQEVGLLRVTRVFHADKVLRPYNEYEADGNKILMQADKGRYAKSDFYVVHAYPVDGKNYLFLTNKQILYISKSDILNDWESVWRLTYNDIKGEPVVDQNRITFNLHSTEMRKSVFKRKVGSRSVALPSEAYVKWFLRKYETSKIL